MTDYNMEVLARLEERWLDPDCVDEPRDDEEEWNENTDDMRPCCPRCEYEFEMEEEEE